MKLDQLTDEQIIDALPHGSGIDCEWQIERGAGGHVFAHNSFHVMDENGMYDGYQDFQVVLFVHDEDKRQPLKGPCEGQTQILHRKGDVDFYVKSVGGPWREDDAAYGLSDYLEDTIGYALQEAGIVNGVRSEYE